MTRLRSNHYFAGLMFLAFVTAFFIPHRISDRGRANVQALFAPVAVPTRFFAGVIHDRVWPYRSRDDASPDTPRDVAAVYAENDKLRVELANVVGQLQHYRTLASELENLGKAADFCTRYTVMGGDTGARDSLNIVGKSTVRLKQGMPALNVHGLIGRVERSGAGGATIQLLTDKGAKFTAAIGRNVETADGLRFQTTVPPTLVQGAGRGSMRAAIIDWNYVKNGALRLEDWVILKDDAWPRPVDSYRVGKVTRIEQSRDNILFAEVTIEPFADPRQLREVMVMDR